MKGLNENITSDTMKRELLKYLKEEHRNLVKEVIATKKVDLFTVYCDSWKSAKAIAATENGKLMEHDVNFTLFSKEEPSSN